MQQYAPWIAAMSQALAAGDAGAFSSALAGFDGARNCELTLQVRRVAGGLQDALERFSVDSKLIDLARQQVPDARHRLAHVMRLTDDAAHRTMDLVEQCCPLAVQIAEQAERLICLQQAQAAQEAASPESLHGQFAAFLKQTGTSMAAVRSNLSEVLLTQGYQDLSGQIIRSVMTLVDELELALGDLVRMTGAEPAARAAGMARSQAVDDDRGHGPAVPGISHGTAVGGQQDVDALLSDLGM